MTQAVAVRDNALALIGQPEPHWAEGLAYFEIADIVRQRPDLVPSLRRELEAVEAALSVGSRPEAIEPIIVGLESAWPAMRSSEAESRARARLYARSLQSWPLEAVRYAADKAMRSLKFFPALSELVELCDEHTLPLRRRRAAIRAALLAAKK